MWKGEITDTHQTWQKRATISFIWESESFKRILVWEGKVVYANVGGDLHEKARNF